MISPINFRLLVSFAFVVGAIVGIVAAGAIVAAWRIGWWLWQHLQWVQ